MYKGCTIYWVKSKIIKEQIVKGKLQLMEIIEFLKSVTFSTNQEPSKFVMYSIRDIALLIKILKSKEIFFYQILT